MSIKDRLIADLKVAMKEKDALKKSTITMLRAAVKQQEVDNRVELSDEEILDIVSKQVKQKRGAIEEFQKGDRMDLVEEAQNEIEVLMNYLPEQMSEEELLEVVKSVVAEVGASSPKEMGKVMGALMPKIKGKADSKLASKYVKDLLG
ncbi:MAG: GatB/YqeY domain-containing protein [Firmicutes bacterium]|jgi:uncharacterized protein YqeY|nr:GatB/YqeY domain-containing protein [Bacillota bacterium]